jgi:hypothetical protein
MMLARLIVFALTAAALAGCCASGNGCYVPVPGVPTAWDGAGTRPSEGGRPDDGVPPRRQAAARRARPNTEVIIGPITSAREEATPHSEQEWAQKEAADRAADAKLTKQLMICRDCMPARDDDVSGSASR